MEKLCVQCGDHIGLKTEFVYCIKCLKSAVNRYCHLGDESSSNRSSFQKSRTRKHTDVESDEETSSKKPKKIRTGDESEGLGKSFWYSFAGFREKRHVISREKGPKSEKHAANEEQQLYESDAYAEPLIRSVWTGSFNVWYDKSIYRRMDWFHAFLSSKACPKVCNLAAEFQKVLQFEMLPKYCVWPKSFQGSGPTDDDIAVYFFPSLMKHENVYDSLVFEMIRDDLAMRAFVQNSELLIFTSVELPSRFWRFQGKLYLWGVFRGKQAPLHLRNKIRNKILFCNRDLVM